MSFFDYLDTVRARPVEDRKRLLVVWTGLVMFVIAVLWVINMFWILEPAVQGEAEVVATSSGAVVSDQVESPSSGSSWRDHITRIRVGIEAVTDMVQSQVSGDE